MTELEILQQRFSEMAQQFPGLIHILTIWPKDEKEPNLNPKYMPTEDNLLIIWGHGLVGRYVPEINMKHWLIKPRYASWNKDHASENCQNLAEKAGRVLREKGLLPRLKLPECILKLSEYKLTIRQKVQLWVLVVHELGNTRSFVSEPRDIKTSFGHDLNIKRFEKEPIHAYYEVQKDFFLDSSLVISQLLEIEKEITQAEDAIIKESDKWPDDLITLTVAQSKYHVTTLTLRRAIADGRLRSCRPTNCSKNHPHKVSESQVASRWPAKIGQQK